MIRSHHRSLRQLVLVLLFAGAAAAASAKPPEFPPISEAERAMTGVPGYPTNIPAVVLFKKALLSTTDPDTGPLRPHLHGQRAPQDPHRRRSPALREVLLHHNRRLLFDYADRDEVEMTLHWPAGWKPDTLPSDTLYKGAAGAAVTSITVDEPGRSLIYHRRFDIAQRELPKTSYPAVQALFGVIERHDAQTVTLVRQ